MVTHVAATVFRRKRREEEEKEGEEGSENTCAGDVGKEEEKDSWIKKRLLVLLYSTDRERGELVQKHTKFNLSLLKQSRM